MKKLYFHHHYSSLQCHMIFRNHYNILIFCSRNNVENSLYIYIYFFRFFLMNKVEKNSIYFKYFFFFTVTFYQFNASLLNNNLTNPKLLNCSVYKYVLFICMFKCFLYISWRLIQFSRLLESLLFSNHQKSLWFTEFFQSSSCVLLCMHWICSKT